MNDYRFRIHLAFLILTSPGVVIHEIAHVQFCRYYQISISEKCYFQLGDPAGYVIHARPNRYSVSFMISIAPVFVNTFATFISGVLFAYLITPFTGVNGLFEPSPWYFVGVVFAGWIGVATGFHAFPSPKDVQMIWKETRRNWYNPFVLVVIPITATLKLLNILRFIRVHIIIGLTLFISGILFWVHIDDVIAVTELYFGL